MLVLSRKIGESIVINNNVEIIILESSDGTVKIGINAPKSIKILRKEIINQIIEENTQSITSVDEILKKLKK